MHQLDGLLHFKFHPWKFMWIFNGKMMHFVRITVWSKEKETPIWNKRRKIGAISPRSTMDSAITIKNYTILYVSELIIIRNWEREKETSCDSFAQRIHTHTHTLYSIDISMCAHNKSAGQQIISRSEEKKETKFTICNLKSCTFHVVWNTLHCTLQYRLQQQHKTRYESAAWFVAISFCFVLPLF